MSRNASLATRAAVSVALVALGVARPRSAERPGADRTRADDDCSADDCAPDDRSRRRRSRPTNRAPDNGADCAAVRPPPRPAPAPRPHAVVAARTGAGAAAAPLHRLTRGSTWWRSRSSTCGPTSTLQLVTTQLAAIQPRVAAADQAFRDADRKSVAAKNDADLAVERMQRRAEVSYRQHGGSVGHVLEIDRTQELASAAQYVQDATAVDTEEVNRLTSHRPAACR